MLVFFLKPVFLLLLLFCQSTVHTNEGKTKIPKYLFIQIPCNLLFHVCLIKTKHLNQIFSFDIKSLDPSLMLRYFHMIPLDLIQTVFD